tara:strand:+ start:148 stop:1638 length:1491 start_codon:yes stop_codon:yes gene_type:complete
MINYQSKFDFNLKYLDSSEYDLYHKSLIEYYNKDSICDISGDGNLIKTNKDGILKIECKKSGYFLKIVDAKYVNINCELNNIRDKKKVLKANIEKLLITDDIKNIKDNFIKIKDKYIDLTKEEEEIKKIFSIQEKNINEIESGISEIYYEMMSLFLKRKELFNNITNKKLDYKKKEYIMNFLKSSTKNTFDDTTIHNLSSKIKVDKNDTKNWVYWIKSCVKYIYFKLKLQKAYSTKKDLINKYNSINHNFIINEPSVDKSKNIELKKGGGFIDPMNNSNQIQTLQENNTPPEETKQLEQNYTESEMEVSTEDQNGGAESEIDVSEDDQSVGAESNMEVSEDDQSRGGESEIDVSEDDQSGGDTDMEVGNDQKAVGEESERNNVLSKDDHNKSFLNNNFLGGRKNISLVDETWNKMNNKKQDYSSFRRNTDKMYHPINSLIGNNIKHEKIINKNVKQIHIDTSSLADTNSDSKVQPLPKNDNIKIIKIKASDLVGSY